MNTKTRLAVMLGLLLLGFGVTVWVLRSLHAREAALMLSDLRRDRGSLIDRVVTLNGQSLRNLATDYSNWDDMLAFVQSGDEAWASINIAASLQTFNVHAAWVLRTDGSTVYSVTRQISEHLRTTPWPTATLLARFRQEKFAHFFINIPEGLLEVRAAPIQPSADIKRATEPGGWLLVGQLWDDAYLKAVGTVLDSDLNLLPTGAEMKNESADLGIHFLQPLRGCDGTVVRQLHAYYHPAPLVRLLEDNKNDMLVFYAFGLATIALTLGSLSHWVVNPLRRLEQSMATNSPEPLDGLRNQPNEFGRLARLTEASFSQRAALQREIEERSRAESALRQSETEIRRSAELRTRLARDLHDGVIQAIYAAGLGLEGVRSALQTDPTTAESRVDAVSLSLNQTIRDVRGFITGLEPDGTAGFAQTLQTLASTLEALHPIRIGLEISPEAATRLQPGEQLHALQIVRESVSNALRHGEATHITLQLRNDGSSAMLSIEDNGRGFEPTAVTGGSGLSNLSARASEIGAILRLESLPGKGTRLTLRFAHTS